MSFTGDLEHLPIVDVIQLLHATKKSGTLTVKGRKGQSQLVFEDGFIVSANHANDSLRIGKVLVEIKAITIETLEEALQDQKNAGENHKPLIAMLIERAQVNKEKAFKGLEMLIELTIVEILTWTTGTFSLDVDKIIVSDEYRYFPEKLHQNIHLNTQNVLMDALRIYDEKKRDGELGEEGDAEEEAAAEATADGEEESWTLSAEDLGLADIDRLERRIPGVFSSLDDLDPAESQRRKLRELAPTLSASEQEAFLDFLLRCSATSRAGAASAKPCGPARAVILFSADEFFKHAVTTVCKPEGIPVFATNEEQNLDPIIDQSLAKNALPVLVLDLPSVALAAFAEERIAGLRRQKIEKYPRVPIIQLASPLDYPFSLQAFADGVRTVLPRPVREERNETFAGDTIRFLETFQSYVKGISSEQGEPLVSRLGRSLSALRDFREAPEVALALLQFVAEIFERSLTLIVGQAELIAERGIGIKGEKSAGATPAMGFRIPLAKPSVFRQVVEEGRLFCGNCEDGVLREHLFAAIGAPRRSTVLLLPLRSRGKTISLAYGDFGRQEPSSVPIELLEILAAEAGLVLENAFYRKKLERTPRQG